MEPPNILCPDDVEAATYVGRAFALLTLPPVASVSDNVGVASVSVEFQGIDYNPSDSITLTLAQSPHTLRYKALDTSGNPNFCLLTVTVVGEY